MKYYLIAGEASGDLHGSNLIKSIKTFDYSYNIRFWGGDKMESAGGTLVKHYKDLAFMGFIEVALNLRTILKNLAFCKKDIQSFAPDVIVMIDYPGFNLPMAKWAKANGYKIVWYISPQVWAWKENRVKILKKCVDKMICILPFEKAFYKKWNFEVDYVGHPLTEIIKAELTKETNLQFEKIINYEGIIALLPGSRKQEVSKKLPVMLQVAASMQNYQFVIAKAPGLEDSFYNFYTKDYPNVKCVRDKTYDLLRLSTAAVVTSGTATLETALFGVPQVVCYKGNPISYFIAKRIINIKYISLVNLILNRPVIRELIQDDMNAKNIKDELEKILNNPTSKSQIEEDYKELWSILSNEENASVKVAKIIVHIGNSSAFKQLN